MIAAKDIPKRRRMTIDEVLTRSFKGLLPGMAGMFQWMMITLGVIAINIIPIVILVMSTTGRYFSWYSNPNFSIDDLGTGRFVGILIGFICILLINIAFSFFTTAWFLRLSLDAYNRLEKTFSERLAQTMADCKRLLPILLLSVGAGVIVFVILVAFSYFITETTSISETSEYAIEALNMLINLLTVLVSARLSSWLFLMIEDKMGMIEALKTAWGISRGRMLRIIAYILLLTAIIFGVVMILLVVGFIFWIPALMTDFNMVAVSIAAFLSVVGFLFAGAGLSLLENNFYCAIYYALKRENTPEVEEPKPEGELIF